MESQNAEPWIEYAEYIHETSQLTRNQSYSIAGNHFQIDDKQIAEVLDTSESTVRTQRSRVELADLEEVKKREFWKTPVPGQVFKKVGHIDYFMSDHWENDSNGSGDVGIYKSFPDEKYVVVVEQFTRVLEDMDMEKTDQGVRAVMEDIEKHVIYDTMEEFLENSQHSPRNIPERDTDLNINVSGDIYT